MDDQQLTQKQNENFILQAYRIISQLISSNEKRNAVIKTLQDNTLGTVVVSANASPDTNAANNQTASLRNVKDYLERSGVVNQDGTLATTDPAALVAAADHLGSDFVERKVELTKKSDNGAWSALANAVTAAEGIGLSVPQSVHDDVAARSSGAPGTSPDGILLTGQYDQAPGTSGLVAVSTNDVTHDSLDASGFEGVKTGDPNTMGGTPDASWGEFASQIGNSNIPQINGGSADNSNTNTANNSSFGNAGNEGSSGAYAMFQANTQLPSDVAAQPGVVPSDVLNGALNVQVPSDVSTSSNPSDLAMGAGFSDITSSANDQAVWAAADAGSLGVDLNKQPVSIVETPNTVSQADVTSSLALATAPVQDLGAQQAAAAAQQAAVVEVAAAQIPTAVSAADAQAGTTLGVASTVPIPTPLQQYQNAIRAQYPEWSEQHIAAQAVVNLGNDTHNQGMVDQGMNMLTAVGAAGMTYNGSVLGPIGAPGSAQTQYDVAFQDIMRQFPQWSDDHIRAQAIVNVGTANGDQSMINAGMDALHNVDLAGTIYRSDPATAATQASYDQIVASGSPNGDYSWASAASAMGGVPSAMATPPPTQPIIGSTGGGGIHVM